MYQYIYIRTLTHMHIDTHVHVCTYVYIYIHTIYIRIQPFTYTFLYFNAYMCIRSHAHQHVHTYHTRMCTSFFWFRLEYWTTWPTPILCRPTWRGMMSSRARKWASRFFFFQLRYTFDMTRPYIWHDSSIHVTWLIHTRAMTHSYMRPPIWCWTI